jgi:hypothetical protein
MQSAMQEIVGAVKRFQGCGSIHDWPRLGKRFDICKGDLETAYRCSRLRVRPEFLGDTGGVRSLKSLSRIVTCYRNALGNSDSQANGGGGGHRCEEEESVEKRKGGAKRRRSSSLWALLPHPSRQRLEEAGRRASWLRAAVAAHASFSDLILKTVYKTLREAICIVSSPCSETPHCGGFAFLATQPGKAQIRWRLGVPSNAEGPAHKHQHTAVVSEIGLIKCDRFGSRATLRSRHDRRCATSGLSNRITCLWWCTLS